MPTESHPRRYVTRGGRRLRLGITTGSCAALAAKGATALLLGGREANEGGEAEILTPGGTLIVAELLETCLTGGTARCAVRKDAGDDPDVTDGVLVFAEVACIPEKTVRIDGGVGVGRVTRPGLDQPVGAAAINSVPRRMIEQAVREACREAGYDGGVSVVISIPDGERLATKTFNPKLGITGGLSVIGTSGTVEPMSNQAVIDTIAVEMNMRRAAQEEDLILTPGNYGAAFLQAQPGLADRHFIRCSNFIGEALDLAGSLGFSRVLVVGHAGKLVKLAGGIMDTHSRVADCRLDLLALHAALAGAAWPVTQRVLECATVDEGLDLLDREDLRGKVTTSLLARIDMHLERRADGRFQVGAVMFTNQAGLLGRSPGAEKVMASWA